MTRIFLEHHPMKSGVKQLLKAHFSDSIVNNFVFLFEAEIYDTQNIKNQLRDDKLIMEVRYKTGPETTEYICDVFSNMTKEQTQYKLLRYITDAYKAGKIGRDWTDVGGKIVSKEITSGKHETKEVEPN